MKYIRRIRFFIVLLIGLFISISSLEAQHLTKKGTPDRRYKAYKTASYKTAATKVSSTSKSYKVGTISTIKRDKKGKIKRSESAKHDFLKQTGYPHGRRGYVVDHIVPLKKGGCDCPSNMQWQTVAEGKAKDKWE